MRYLEAERIQIRDPLSEETRRTRKSLLGTSAVGIVIIWTKLLPTRISTLGIDFSVSDQSALLDALGLIVGYYLVSFVAYAVSDFVDWRLARASAAYEYDRSLYAEGREMTVKTHGAPADLREELEMYEMSEGNTWRGSHSRADAWAQRVVPKVSVMRAIVEFGLPLAVGIYAVLALFTTEPPIQP